MSRARADNAGKVLLNVEDVSLAFGGVKALQQVSFDVYEHEIRAIIGPNGAGKSSMLNVINGVYTPQQGRITFRGKVRANMDPHEAAAAGISRTFQSLALFKGMSVLDNIMTGRNLRMNTGVLWQALHVGPARREELRHREFVEHIIDFLEIQAYRKTAVGRLPYGLQKRVDLGRALAMEPKLLLLDEPMAGMNLEEKEDMCRFVLDVNEEFGTTIVLIEHDMGVVMDISDRVVVLDYGKKIGDGMPDQVRNSQNVIDAYLGRRALMGAYLLKNWAVVVLIAALVIGMALPLATGISAPGFYFEVMLGGLMSGVLYSLVALGLVLIFKASGVFNFAQGAMVLFGALAVARMSEVMPLPVAFVLAIGVMAILAWLIERLVLRHLVNQDAVVLLMATLGVSFFLDGFGQTIWGSDIYQIDTGLPKTPVLVAENIFQGGILINTEDLVAAAAAALLVIALALFFQKTPTGRALRAVADDHQAAQSIGIPLNRIWVIVWTVAGVVALVAGVVWGSKLGVQFSVSLVALKALPVVILGGFTSVPGAILGGLIIGVGEKFAEVFLGPILVKQFDLAGGGIENWFAYVLALLFLLVRPEGLFGEKHIDRV